VNRGKGALGGVKDGNDKKKNHSRNSKKTIDTLR